MFDQMILLLAEGYIFRANGRLGFHSLMIVFFASEPQTLLLSKKYVFLFSWF